MEVALPIIQVDDLRIWGVIAEHHVQIAIPVNVDQPPRVRALRCIAEIVGGQYVASAVAEEDSTPPGPMSFPDEHNVEIAVSIQITDAHVGGGIGGRLKQKDAIEVREACRIDSGLGRSSLLIRSLSAPS